MGFVVRTTNCMLLPERQYEYGRRDGRLKLDAGTAKCILLPERQYANCCRDGKMSIVAQYGTMFYLVIKLPNNVVVGLISLLQIYF